MLKNCASLVGQAIRPCGNSFQKSKVKKIESPKSKVQSPKFLDPASQSIFMRQISFIWILTLDFTDGLWTLIWDFLEFDFRLWSMSETENIYPKRLQFIP